MRVRADLEARPVLALVHVGVHVAHDREADFLGRVLEHRDRPDIDHLVDGGRQRDRCASHPRDTRAPDAAGDDDGVGGDVTAVGLDATDVPVDDVDPGHLDARHHGQRAHVLRLLAHERARLQRVDDTDARRVEAAQDHRLVDERDHLLDLGRGEEADALDTPRGRRRDASLELFNPLLRPRDLDATGLVVDTELAVLAGAVDREGRHLLGAIGQEDEVRGMARGAAGARQRTLVEQDDVPPALLGQVIRHAVADDAGADDDDVRSRRDRAHADPPPSRSNDVVPAEDTPRPARPAAPALDHLRWPTHPREPRSEEEQATVASLFIDGAWVASADGACSPVICPSDGSIVTEVDVATDEQVAAAIGAARRAFDLGDWPRTPSSERAALLRRFADLLDRDLEALAAEETANTGKALRESRIDIGDVIKVFRYYGDLVSGDDETERRVDAGSPAVVSRVVHEPIGVCGLIGPWNYPLLQMSWKVAPALAAGNTIVMKPAMLTPLTTIHLTRLLDEAGAAAGVVNLVLGPGERVGQALGDSPDVDLVSLTGGLVAGRALMRGAAGNVKRVALELGGKSP